MELNIRDFTLLLIQSYKRYKDGYISEQTAYREAYMLNNIIKSIEVTELEARLERIEGVLQNGK